MSTLNLSGGLHGGVSTADLHDQGHGGATGGFDGSPAAGTDAAILESAKQLVQAVSSSKLPGETANFNVEFSNGAVKVSGSTNSVMLHQRLHDIIPKIKAIQGVSSVDLSAVRGP